MRRTSMPLYIPLRLNSQKATGEAIYNEGMVLDLYVLQSFWFIFAEKGNVEKKENMTFANRCCIDIK